MATDSRRLRIADMATRWTQSLKQSYGSFQMTATITSSPTPKADISNAQAPPFTSPASRHLPLHRAAARQLRCRLFIQAR